MTQTLAGRHHCGTCHRFVANSTVSVYFNLDENCEIGSGYCSHCGGVDVYLADRDQSRD